MEGTRFLIPIDSTNIRKKAIKELKATIKKFDQSKTDINKHLNESRPEFQSWFHSSCGLLIEKIQKINETYQTKELEVREVLAYAEYYRIPAEIAYLRIQKRKQFQSENKKDYDAFYDEEESGYWDSESDNEKYSDNSSEDYDEDFHQTDGKHSNKNNYKEYSGSSNESSKKRNTKNENSNSNESNWEITMVFRKIVRILHPDKNSNLTQEDKENWNNAIRFYQEKNLQGLNEILTWIHIYKEDRISEVSITDIRLLNNKYKKDLKIFQKEIKNYKKEPDWCFNLKTKTEKSLLKKQIDKELRIEISEIQSNLKVIEEELHYWEQFAKSYYKLSSKKFP